MPSVQGLSQGTLDDQLGRVTIQLEHKYRDRADAAEIAAAVREEASRFEGAKVTQYVPVLVQHAVQERFRRRSPRHLTVV
jgi:hypothetical protein